MGDRLKLYWLPDQSDWTAKFQLAQQTRDWTSLIALANHKLSFREMLKLDQLISANETPRSSSTRIAIFGTSTVDHLASGIRVAMLRRGLSTSIWVGDYGNTSVAAAQEALACFAPDFILFAHDCFDLARGVGPGLSAEEVRGRVDTVVQEIVGQWDAAAARYPARIIQQLSSPAVFPTLVGQNESSLTGSPAAFTAVLNNLLRTEAMTRSVDCLSLDEAAARDGIDAWHDRVAWHRAKHFVAPRAVPLFGELVARIIQAGNGMSAKCLVLDLDNTLWGGVVGDDGLDGIVVGQGNAEGEAFASFQRYAKDLAARGIILAVASKNDEANGREPFQRHPDMILRETDIASFQANWGSKADSLRAIAADLDIGIDSLVFVDDNPFERALVRELEPRVLVPEVGDDPSDFAQCLADAGYFEAASLTDEDRNRSNLYVARAAARPSPDDVPDMASYLDNLQMRLIWGRIDGLSMKRSTQLIGKTNQFNLTTRRYSEAAVAELSNDRRYLPLQFRLVDRFSDNGLIAVVIGLQQDDTLTIDTWLMSCRVLRRGVEAAIFSVIVAQARERGCRYIAGDYLPTAKNEMVSRHYASLGFEEMEAAQDMPAGSTRWRVAVDKATLSSTAIAIEPSA